MDDRYVHLESAVEQLRLTVMSLQDRVAALEAGAAAATPMGASLAAASATPAESSRSGSGRPRRDPYDPIVLLSLIGRLFLVLAGGFFLRAMTEAGVLAPAVGVGLAFVYGLVWLVLADRANRLRQTSSAQFHAVGAAMVVFPLLVEATTRFEVIGVAGSVSGLVLLTAAFLFLAIRQRMHAVAWITVVAALLTSLVLLLKTGFAPVFALYLIALGITTLWLAYAQGWTLIRWPAALVADLVVGGLALRAFTLGQPAALRVAMLLQVTLVVAYLAGIAVRTLLRDRNVTLFEVTQTGLVLVIGFGGAVAMTRATGTLSTLMGLASLVLGAACYGLAFRFVGRHADHERNVHFYATLGLVLMLAGLPLDLHGAWLGAVLGVLAVIAAAAWSRSGRLELLLHGVAYLVAAGIASGALGYSTWILVSSPRAWAVPGAAVVGVVVAAAVSAWMIARRPYPEGGTPASVMRVLVLLVLVWAVSGCLVGYLAALAAGSAGGQVDLGALATVRTGVLAVVTLLVAGAARQGRLKEWAWLVYPLLVFIGLKMVAQDFKRSRPATLFIALALYGIALIVAPRLRRARAAVSSAAAGHSEPARIT